MMVTQWVLVGDQGEMGCIKWTLRIFLLVSVTQRTSQALEPRGVTPLPAPATTAARGAVTVQTTQDSQDGRRNTLLDDADDLQRQLDNEARDRFQQAKPKALWVFHFPGRAVTEQIADTTGTRRKKRQGSPSDSSQPQSATSDKECATAKHIGPAAWNYSSTATWVNDYPSCAGRSQSPVDLYGGAMVRVRSSRALTFKDYDVLPQALTLHNDGKKLTLKGCWLHNQWPSLWGGPAHSRRYLFHSVQMHWPSEHQVSSLQYPLEVQAMHYAAEYPSMEAALHSSDPEALLGVAYLYDYNNYTEPGLQQLLTTAIASSKTEETTTLKTLLENPVQDKDNVISGETKSPEQKEEAEWDVADKSSSIYEPKEFEEREVTVAVERRARNEYYTNEANSKPEACTDKYNCVMALKTLCPVFSRQYATYAGSLTAPPCKEIVRWIVYSKSLAVRKDVLEAARNLRSVDGHMRSNFRSAQSLNDRKVYYFY